MQRPNHFIRPEDRSRISRCELIYITAVAIMLSIAIILCTWIILGLFCFVTGFTKPQLVFYLLSVAAAGVYGWLHKS